MRRKMMFTGSGVLAATVAAGIGVAGLTGTATGASPEPANVAALQTAPSASLPADAQRILAGSTFAERGVNLSASRAVPAPGDTAERWYLVPGSDGACLVTAESTTVCAPGKAVNDGGLRVLEITGAAPAAKDGRPAAGSVTINGVAPDGVARVRVVGPDGGSLAESSVSSNVYGVTIKSLPAGSKLQLINTDGSIAASPIGG
jgi:hypothetical protein